jgi:chaperone required for assembly of F1-ATPase
MRRVYTTVAVAPSGTGHAILLDGKPVRTPGGRIVEVPTPDLARALADEWDAQTKDILPDTMPLVRLTATALDLVAPRFDAVKAETARYGGTDLLCYRAADPPELAARQQAVWGPLLDWALLRYGADLIVTDGLMPVAQPPEALAALEAAVGALDVWRLTGLAAALPVLGSLVLALATIDGRLTAEEAYALSQLDESFQIERWGEDDEVAASRAIARADLAAVTRFLRLLSA